MAHTTTISDGWHSMSMESYLEMDGLSSSGLKSLARSPEHFRASQEEPREPTRPMIVGTALHTAILEPELFPSSYCLEPDYTKWGKNRNTKGYKGAVAAMSMSGRIILNVDEMAACEAIQEKLMDPSTAGIREIMGAPHSIEKVGYYTGWDFPIKIRPDWMSPSIGHIIDLKTTEDASADSFQRTMVRYKYHLSAALYIDVARLLGASIQTFSFLVVERKPPYGMVMYDLDEEAIEQGRREYGGLLADVSDCYRTNSWPSYKGGDINLPIWYFRRWNDTHGEA